MSKRVLVTGGAGLIGSHLVDLLIAKGHHVTILDNLDPETHPNGTPEWLNPKAEFIHGDMRNEADVKKALTNCQWVFHQAAFGGFTSQITQYIDVNATGTARLFEIIQQHQIPVEKIVVASSQAIYGEGRYLDETGQPADPAMRSETHFEQAMLTDQWDQVCSTSGKALKQSLTSESKPQTGETIYALSKLTEERLALALGKRLGIPTAALRYAVTYGPRQSVYNPYTGVVSIFTTRLLNNQAPVVYEDGQQTRDFLYVGDNARANLFVMEGLGNNPDYDYHAFNVGTQKPTAIADLIRRLAALLGKAIEPELRNAYRPGDVRHFVHDCSKLYRLGWQPETSLPEGLAQTVKWIQEQGNIESQFDQAETILKQCGVVRDSQATQPAFSKATV